LIQRSLIDNPWHFRLFSLFVGNDSESEYSSILFISDYFRDICFFIFVGSRTLLITFSKKPDESFAWFYSAPIYVEALAPAVGAFLIWRFSFVGVFIFSFIIHFLNIIYSLKPFYKIRIPQVSSVK